MENLMEYPQVPKSAFETVEYLQKLAIRAMGVQYMEMKADPHARTLTGVRQMQENVLRGR